MKILMLFALILLQSLSAQAQIVSMEVLKSLPALQGKATFEAGSFDYLVLDFWASWCGPCESSFPFYKQQSRLWKDRKVLWIGINTDSDLNEARSFLKKFESNFTHLSDSDRKFSNSLEVDTLPRVFILDSQGKIVFAERGFSSRKRQLIESKFKELFSKP